MLAKTVLVLKLAVCAASLSNLELFRGNTRGSFFYFFILLPKKHTEAIHKLTAPAVNFMFRIDLSLSKGSQFIQNLAPNCLQLAANWFIQKKQFILGYLMSKNVASHGGNTKNSWLSPPGLKKKKSYCVSYFLASPVALPHPTCSCLGVLMDGSAKSTHVAKQLWNTCTSSVIPR